MNMTQWKRMSTQNFGVLTIMNQLLEPHKPTMPPKAPLLSTSQCNQPSQQINSMAPTIKAAQPTNKQPNSPTTHSAKPRVEMACTTHSQGHPGTSRHTNPTIIPIEPMTLIQDTSTPAQPLQHQSTTPTQTTAPTPTTSSIRTERATTILTNSQPWQASFSQLTQIWNVRTSYYKNQSNKNVPSTRNEKTEKSMQQQSSTF